MPLFEKKPQFYAIQTFQNQQTFYSGYNPVCGNIILDLVEPKKARAVYVQFIGIAETEWTETETYTDSNGESRTRSVTYRQTEELIHLKQAVWTPPSGIESDFLPPGRHIMPFRFDIPPTTQLPPTFNNGVGSVTYTIKSNIDRPWKYDHRTYLPVTMLPIVDMNDPTYDREVSREDSKTICCCCCADGPIALKARLPSTGWCPGECMPFVVSVENISSKPMNGITCAVDYSTSMRAQGHTKTENKRIASEKDGNLIAPGDSVTRTIYLRVPPACPTFRCGIIDHSYTACVTLHLPAGSFNLHLHLPIQIGTIPHAFTPLFPEQKAALEESARQAAYSWANRDAIVAAAAAANANAPTAQMTEYADAYQGDEPSYAAIPGDTQYAYFQMPMPSAPPPGMQNQYPAGAPGGEQAPLLGSAGPAAPQQAGGMAPEAAPAPQPQGNMAMPLAFGAPAKAFDIPQQ